MNLAYYLPLRLCWLWSSRTFHINWDVLLLRGTDIRLGRRTRPGSGQAWWLHSHVVLVPRGLAHSEVVGPVQSTSRRISRSNTDVRFW